MTKMKCSATLNQAQTLAQTSGRLAQDAQPYAQSTDTFASLNKLSKAFGDAALYLLEDGLLGDPASKEPDPSTAPCKACGQTDVGQTGEYPCLSCKLPMVHDLPEPIIPQPEEPKEPEHPVDPDPGYEEHLPDQG